MRNKVFVLTGGREGKIIAIFHKVDQEIIEECLKDRLHHNRIFHIRIDWNVEEANVLITTHFHDGGGLIYYYLTTYETEN